MSDVGSSVTLILYSIDPKWWTGTEPLLNLIAAAAQRSSFTHVELAIGEDAGAHGEMINVLRIFNDETGVELANRTGKNPNYQYVQIGCSKSQERAMLAWARQQVGKPFSSMGMVRSMIWPRTTNESSWYCAELVAACLKVGGLMHRDSRPGEATPRSLYKLYKSQGAVQANPYTLRRDFSAASPHTSVVKAAVVHAARLHDTPSASTSPSTSASTSASKPACTFSMTAPIPFVVHPQTARIASRNSQSTHRAPSPPRLQFRVLDDANHPRIASSNGLVSTSTIALRLSSLQVQRPSS